MIPRISVIELSDYIRNVGYHDEAITCETRTFGYDCGIKLVIDVMDMEEAGVLD